MFNTLKLDLSLYEKKSILRKRNNAFLLIVILFLTFFLLAISIIINNKEYILSILLALSVQLVNFEIIKLVLENEIKSLNKIRFIQALLNLIIPLILLKLKNDVFLIVISNIFINLLIYAFYKKNQKLKFNKFTLKKLKIYLKKYKRYIVYTCPAELTGSFSAYIPIIFIENKFSPIMLGLFTMATRISYTPIGLVSKSIGEYLRASLTKNDKKESNLILKILIFLSLMLFLIMKNIDDKILSYFLGQSWAGVSELINIMSLFVSLKLIASTISFILFHYKKNHIDLTWQIINLVGILIICLISVEYIEFVINYSNFSLAMYLILTLTCLRLYLNDKNN
ncbi:hypothetical protein EYZ66_11575 [Aequoribacter fuscus]|nr:hypothetical protein [Aequoribacter fuscus]QHJ88892.1 hypothetical protein EYZ66_11575 [Aequoribacter fuscus]